MCSDFKLITSSLLVCNILRDNPKPNHNKVNINYQLSLRVDFHCHVILNRDKVWSVALKHEVKRGSTFAFTRDLLYIASLLFPMKILRAAYARKNYVTVEIHP